MVDSKQYLRDEMLGEVRSHLRDRFLVGIVDVSPNELGLLFGQMYFSPQNKGLLADVCRCTQDPFVAPIQHEYSEPMQPSMISDFTAMLLVRPTTRMATSNTRVLR